MVAHAFNPSSPGAETGGSLQSKFLDSRGYREKPYLKTQNRKERKEGMLALESTVSQEKALLESHTNRVNQDKAKI